MHIEHREIGDKGMFGIIFLLTPCVPSNTYQLTLNGTTLHTLGIEGNVELFSCPFGMHYASSPFLKLSSTSCGWIDPS
jgi:hypothetical protein